jgi:beta-N-acetylhexosaminidase
MVKLRKSNGRMLKKSISLVFSSFSLSYHFRRKTRKNHWIDSVFQTLNTQEKIGQLFMISADAYTTPESLEELSDLVRSYRPGGILITRGGPKSHAQLINNNYS